jgi:hypothetical protein
METYTRTYSYKLDWQANAGKLVALDALYKECVRVRPLINQVKPCRYTAVLFKQFEQIKLSLSTT